MNASVKQDISLLGALESKYPTPIKQAQKATDRSRQSRRVSAYQSQRAPDSIESSVKMRFQGLPQESIVGPPTGRISLNLRNDVAKMRALAGEIARQRR